MHRHALKNIIVPDFRTHFERPLVLTRICAGFPSPAEDYIEGRIDLNRDLIRNEFSTFYFRVTGDSMMPEIKPGALLIVDRQLETSDGDIIVARLDGDLCVKVLSFKENGSIFLRSINPNYEPIRIEEGSDFEVWGSVVHAIHSFKNFRITPLE